MTQALTVQGVADRWQMSTQQVYNLIKAGDLRAFRIGRARGYRVSMQEIERWESGGANSGDTAATASPSNGAKAFPLPPGAMKALAN